MDKISTFTRPNFYLNQRIITNYGRAELTQEERDPFELKFIYSEKAAKFCEIFPLLLSTVHTDKSKGKISQNFVAFSEYMNFNAETIYRISANSFRP